MIQTKILDKLREAVSTSRCDSKFDKAPCVAILSGPCTVIEAVLYEVQRTTGIQLDWSYSGGRAGVYSFGDKNKIKTALEMEMVRDISSENL